MPDRSKLSEVAYNILIAAAANENGIRLTHSKTALMLEERGVIRRDQDRIHITDYGLSVLRSTRWK